MDNRNPKVSGIGWVLPTGTGSGTGLSAQAPAADTTGDDGALKGFSPKQYLTSVKGYLDPASGYCLAAAALALGARRVDFGEEVRDDAGVTTVSRYGSPLSAFRFYDQLVRKGARYASPLVFPHGYANTPGNLVAIEYGFGGPHLVLTAGSDVREAWLFAIARLLDGSAVDMLVGAFEAVVPQAVPDGVRVLNGAVVVWLSTADSAPGIMPVDDGALAMGPGVEPTATGAVAEMLRALHSLR